MSALEQVDPEVAEIIRFEERRQQQVLEMIPSENYASAAVMEAVGSVLTNKYAEGYPGARYYHGNAEVDRVEDLGRERAKALFGMEHANLQPHSGAQANMAVYLALLNFGDTVMGLQLDAGGHLTHGSPVNASGKQYNFVPYAVDRESHLVDYDVMEQLAKEHKPKVIVTGATAYPRLWDFKRARAIADEVGAILIADMAHLAGLIAGGAHPSPAGHAQVVTSSTHKTLRGPRGGMILCDANLRRKIDSGVFPGTQGGPLMHVIAGKAVMLKEAATEEFKQYAHQVVANSKTLAQVLLDAGFTLVSGGTDNHLVLIDVTKNGLTGVEAADALEAAGIVVNFNSIPFDTHGPRVGGGIRFGTPAITSRGMGEAEMQQIGEWMARVLRDVKDNAEHARVRDEVFALTAKFPARGVPVR
ncbi:MAG: serine hydroxymethyltransferase [Dehalococcoidia bacterium]